MAKEVYASWKFVQRNDPSASFHPRNRHRTRSPKLTVIRQTLPRSASDDPPIAREAINASGQLIPETLSRFRRPIGICEFPTKALRRSRFRGAPASYSSTPSSRERFRQETRCRSSPYGSTYPSEKRCADPTELQSTMAP